MGADLVLDMKIAEDLSILEQQDEFINKFRERKEGGKHPGTFSNIPTFFEDISDKV